MDTEYREIQAILVTEKGLIGELLSKTILNDEKQNLVYKQTTEEELLVYTSYTHKPLNSVLLSVTNIISELMKNEVNPKLFSVLEYQNSIKKWIRPTDDTYAFPYFISQVENEAYAVLEFYFPTKRWQNEIEHVISKLESLYSEILFVRFCWSNYLTFFTLKLHGQTLNETQTQIEKITDTLFQELKNVIDKYSEDLQETSHALYDESSASSNLYHSLDFDQSIEQVIIEAFTSEHTKGVVYLKDGACPVRIELFGEQTTIFPESNRHPLIPYSQLPTVK